ncbi:MAG: hypothetical protein JXL80_05700 [Planctomycetes bacterium]|nr:hypothetical protein [Planctomycetota bacterium]
MPRGKKARESKTVTLTVKRESIKRLLEDADEEIKRAANEFAANRATTTHDIREAVREYERLREIFDSSRS